MKLTWPSYDATTLTYGEGYIGHGDPVSSASPLQVLAIKDTMKVILVSIKREYTHSWANWAIPV